MVTMPRRCASCGEAMVTFSPPNSMVPRSGCCAPERILISVDLPAPFSPSRAWISPERTSKPASSSAWTPGNRLLISDMRSSGSVIEWPRATGERGRWRRLKPSDCAKDQNLVSCPRRLFHFVQPLGLIQVFAGDRNRSKQHRLLFRLFTLAKKRYQGLERPAHLATGHLLDGGRKVACTDLSEGLGQSVKADQLHFAEEVTGLQGL